MLFVDIGSYENEKIIFKVLQLILIYMFFSIFFPIRVAVDAYFKLL